LLKDTEEEKPSRKNPTHAIALGPAQNDHMTLFVDVDVVDF